jgi:hypothetical protein
VHLIIESESTLALTRGMQGLGIRLAKALNRLLGRHGRVWSDRYHARALRTPREVRNGLVYVLLNARKHGAIGRGIDPCSSGPWFGGWREAVSAPPGLSPLARARTWLLSVGCRRGGLVGMGEAPAVPKARSVPAASTRLAGVDSILVPACRRQWVIRGSCTK